MDLGVALIPGDNNGLILATIPLPPPAELPIFASDGHDHPRPLCARGYLLQENRGLDAVADAIGKPRTSIS